jgi:hypothetical protein
MDNKLIKILIQELVYLDALYKNNCGLIQQTIYAKSIVQDLKLETIALKNAYQHALQTLNLMQT